MVHRIAVVDDGIWPVSFMHYDLKKVLKIVRADLTLYATRQLVADWLDNSTVAKRTRDRILGHVTDVPGGYGRKGSINADQMAAISALEALPATEIDRQPSNQ